MVQWQSVSKIPQRTSAPLIHHSHIRFAHRVLVKSALVFSLYVSADKADSTQLLYRGELPRADAANIVGTGERQARRVVSALLEIGVLTSDSARRCASLSPRLSPRAGCLVCSQKGRDDGPPCAGFFV